MNHQYQYKRYNAGTQTNYQGDAENYNKTVHIRGSEIGIQHTRDSTAQLVRAMTGKSGVVVLSLTLPGTVRALRTTDGTPRNYIVASKELHVISRT